MKDYFENINKAFESKARLGIMSVLMVDEKVDFSTLKETLQLTDGNLASHLRALEDAEYLISGSGKRGTVRVIRSGEVSEVGARN